MGRAERALAALACCLALGGCSRIFDLAATVVDGKLAFAVLDRPPSLARRCTSSIDVRDGYGRQIWTWSALDGRFDDCPGELPLVYGHAPRAGRTDVLPIRPELNQIYVMTVSMPGALLRSVFRMRREGRFVVVETLDPDRSPEAAAAAMMGLMNLQLDNGL